MSAPVPLVTLVYALWCWCAVVPPGELLAAGLSLPQLLEQLGLLPCEELHFLHHHLRRVAANIVVHSLLPLGYIISLLLNGWSPSETYMNHIVLTAVLTLPLLATYKVMEWSRVNWLTHPLVVNLLPFTTDGNDWAQVAASVDNEFRSVDKILIQNTVGKVIVTSTWIIKTSLYSVQFAHQNDSTLVATTADTHTFSISGGSDAQYVNIEVRPNRTGVKSFVIRVNAIDFKDLQDRMTNPIVILPTVNFQASVMEKFIQIFKQHVEQNSPFYTNQELESCIGCMQAPSNIKLHKQCEDQPNDNRPCTNCQCRPMWCVECMARWWASRQDEDAKNTWLSARCTCPVCRASFCLLDVCPVQSGSPT